MSSFEPSFYRMKLNTLNEDVENTTFSKSDYSEYWEHLRTQWNDAAGRGVNKREMTPLLTTYDELLEQNVKVTQVKERCAEHFEQLQKLLNQAAHHDEQFTDMMSLLSNQSQERDRTLRTSENMAKQVEEQQKSVAAKKQAANSHVKPI